jgi:hypothetical protein
VNPISDRGPAPAYYDPPDERPEGPHAACLGYGCHLCGFTGELAVAIKAVEDDKTELDFDTKREMERGL